MNSDALHFQDRLELRTQVEKGECCRVGKHPKSNNYSLAHANSYYTYMMPMLLWCDVTCHFTSAMDGTQALVYKVKGKHREGAILFDLVGATISSSNRKAKA